MTKAKHTAFRLLDELNSKSPSLTRLAALIFDSSFVAEGVYKSFRIGEGFQVIIEFPSGETICVGISLASADQHAPASFCGIAFCIDPRTPSAEFMALARHLRRWLSSSAGFEQNEAHRSNPISTEEVAPMSSALPGAENQVNIGFATVQALFPRFENSLDDLIKRQETANDQPVDYLLPTEKTQSKPYDDTTARAKFLKEYEESGKRKQDWLAEESKWTKRSIEYFRRQCRKKETGRFEVLDRIIKAEQKLRRDRTKQATT